MRLTPDQQAALDALPAKQRTFVLAYVGEAHGNAAAAARVANYAHPDQQGSRLLSFVGPKRARFPKVIAAIESLRAPEEERSIATIEELRAFWSSMLRGDVDDVITRDGQAVRVPTSNAVRLRASELLAKSQGAFLERPEVSEPPGMDVVIHCTAEEAAAALRGER